jgi:hypothetical protein
MDTPGSKPASSSAIRRAMRRALAVLPPNRQAAARDAWRATGDLVAGRLPPAWATQPGGPPLDPRRAAAAQAALDEGRLQEALAAADSILASHRRHPVALEVRALALWRGGEVTAAHATLRRLRSAADSPRLDTLERQLTGQLRTVQPGWAPRLPGPPRPVHDRVDGRVLVLAGDPAGGGLAATAARAAGFEPVVAIMAIPGFVGDGPDPAPGDGDAPDGPVIRVDLGRGYPETAPLDRRLEDLTWLLAEIVESERPSLLHVAAGGGLPERAAIGAGLRSRYRVPLVIDAEEASVAGEAVGTELRRLRRAALDRRRAGADAVATKDPAGSTQSVRGAYAAALADRAVQP